MDNKTSKVVLNPRVARQMIKQGAQIIDIKPNKENPIATVFVFKKTPEFDKMFHEMIEVATESCPIYEPHFLLKS